MSEPAFTRANVTDALRYWETGRLFYNAVLALVVVGALFAANDSWNWMAEAIPILIFLAIVANVLYCAAYPVDLLVQASDFRETWRRWRWVLWLAGTGAAALLAAIVLFGMSFNID
ncbi:MAG: hypothetical protein AB7J28_13280 [Hyphomonadaceae bacterium]